MIEFAEEWEVWAGPMLAGTWYEFEIYWNLPPDSMVGVIDVWWNGEHTVHDETIQTKHLVGPGTDWIGYDRQYIGQNGWFGVLQGSLFGRFDTLYDYGCTCVGNVTPTPRVEPTVTPV